MAQFVGLPVLAILREPPAKVRGVVTAVVEQKLTLHQVTWYTGKPGPESLVVNGSNVLDIQIIDSEAVPQDVKEEEFVDPAIVSYGRPEGYLAPDAKINGAFVATTQAAATSHAEPSLHAISPVSTEPATTGAREENQSVHPVADSESVPASATLKAPFDDLSLNENSQENSRDAATLTGPFNDLPLNGTAHEGEVVSVNGKISKHQDTESLDLKEVAQVRAPSSRKRVRKPGARGGPLPTQDSLDMELQSTPVLTQRRRTKGKGWRQTPLLEERTVETPSPQAGQRGQHPPKDLLKPATARFTKQTPDHPKVRRRRYREEEDQNGWATGDATDIQDMGDFDFEENLSKFDKKKVFDQIRQEDTTADEARLVNINRLPAARPGTAGGKNLHYTENVLDSSMKKVPTGSPNIVHSSTESELEVSETKISSGRSSRRNVSRPSRAPSRKGSALTAGDHHGTGSMFVVEPVGKISRQTTHDRIASPKIKTDSSTSRYRKSSASAITGRSNFRIASTNGYCPCVSPLQMLELEQLATTELGITEEMLTENAARCIGETAYGLASNEDAEQTNHRPLVVILAGNTKTGSRAIAAGRHLRNHGARVVLCVLGLERELDLLESVQRQLKIFRSCGGQAIKQDGLMRTLRKLQAPTDLIVDALLGMHLSFEELRTDDQAAYFQLVCWANGSEAGTLAVDLPSGIEPSRGMGTTHDGSELVLNANFVVSLGAPKTGLLLAMDSLKAEGLPSVFVADIGIASVTWKKFGTRKKSGVDFGGEWVAAVKWEEAGRA